MNEIELIKKYYGDFTGLYDPTQVVAHVRILLAEVQRLTDSEDSRRPERGKRPSMYNDRLAELAHECREWRREAELRRAEVATLRADAERAQPVLDAARAWRRWFPSVDSMFVPENALIAAVDAFDAGPGGCAGHTKAVAEEPDLIIYQAWDCDEIGWSDDNGMSGTDVEAVKLAALESFVAWSIEENWCGDPDEVDRFEADLREGLHWRQVGKAWELHRGTQSRSTWQGINIFPTKVGRDTVADIQAKCAKAKADRRAAEGLSSTDTTGEVERA